MLAALLIAVTRSRAAGLRRYHVLGAAIWAMVAGLAGARLLPVLQHPGAFSGVGALLDPTGPVASWGGLLGGAAGLAAYCKVRRVPFASIGDLFASAAGIGIALSRLGCFANGDDFGSATSVCWAVRFPAGSQAFAAQVAAGALDPAAALSQPVHPVQLYLALNGLALFAITSRHWVRAGGSGRVFCLFWMLYCPARFALEYFRGDQSVTVLGVLTVPQFLCVVFGPAAAAAFLVLRVRSTEMAHRHVSGETPRPNP